MNTTIKLKIFIIPLTGNNKKTSNGNDMPDKDDNQHIKTITLQQSLAAMSKN